MAARLPFPFQILRYWRSKEVAASGIRVNAIAPVCQCFALGSRRPTLRRRRRTACPPRVFIRLRNPQRFLCLWLNIFLPGMPMLRSLPKNAPRLRGG
jgi:hypothetical protein